MIFAVNINSLQSSSPHPKNNSILGLEIKEIIIGRNRLPAAYEPPSPPPPPGPPHIHLIACVLTRILDRFKVPQLTRIAATKSDCARDAVWPVGHTYGSTASPKFNVLLSSISRSLSRGVTAPIKIKMGNARNITCATRTRVPPPVTKFTFYVSR